MSPSKSLPTLTAIMLLSSASAGLVGCGDDGGSGDPSDAATSIDAAPQVDGAPVIDAARPDSMPGPDAMLSGAEVVINEFLMDQAGVGSDGDEFVELQGLPNTDYTGLSLLQVDGDVGLNLNPGLVLTENPGCMTDANGICEISVPANTFQNGSQTLLLVMGASVVLNNTDLDANDDGVIENMPWNELIDGVAVINDQADFGYAGATLLMKLTDNGQPTVFGGGSRIPNGIDTNTPGDWVSNTPNFDNSGIVQGEARNTPGAANSVEP